MHGEIAIHTTDFCVPRSRRSLLGIDAALKRIDDEVSPIGQSERLSLQKATGRVLARHIEATTNTPPFDVAAMDGYAANLVSGDAREFTIVSRIPAGQSMIGELSAGEAARIFTGARVPKGAQTVVAQENVRRVGDTILLRCRAVSGENIRRAGEDIACGQTLLQKGRHIGACEIAVAAASGSSHLDVIRRVRVGLIVTGNELQSAGPARKQSQIWDVNTPMMRSLLNDPAIEAVRFEHAPDNADKMEAFLRSVSQEVDCVITTGGISAGEEDYVKPAIAAQGGRLLFSGLAVKPGKPVSFGRLGQACWLGLPGNPVAAFLMWQVIGRHVVAVLAGSEKKSSEERLVAIARPINHKPGRREFRPARLTGTNAQGHQIVDFDDATHAARVTDLASSDGFIVLTETAEDLGTGSLVEFRPYV